MNELVVRGARVHNLAGVDVTLPRNRLVLITGPSGSGKSSLAFDTIYAEGQRRYVESLSTYARQFLERLPKPDVDFIEGLSPALCIRQQSATRNPRSTVGTVTEIHDYLRLLYARVGQPHCPRCGRPIVAFTVQQMVDRVLAMPHGTRFAVLAPIVRGRSGDLRDELEELRKKGFVRIRVDGERHDLGDDIPIDPRQEHSLDVSIDRLSVKPGARQRLTEAVELALEMGERRVRIAPVDGPEELLSERFACARCDITLPEITPQTFSFNDPAGACPNCDGLGWVRRFEPAQVVPDGARSIADGAIAPWGKPGSAYHRHMVDDLLGYLDVDTQLPWQELPERTRHELLWGSQSGGGARPGRGRKRAKEGYEGILPGLERRLREYVRRKRDEGASEEGTFELLEQELGRYATKRTCDDCAGARLRPEALAVTVGGHDIDALSRMPIAQVRRHLASLELGQREAAVAERIVREVTERLEFLVAVGLDYLSLARSAATLSGGEAQRIQLATQIGAGLTGVLYVLDEPSVGLHPRDNARLLDTLRSLRDRGNTVIVVEHDPEAIRAADHVVDMGPGAGREGGRVVASGPPDAIAADPASPTGSYLSGRRNVPIPSRRRRSEQHLYIRDARTHNLKGVDVRLPLDVLCCVTGVSGSGKSSLVVDTLLPEARRHLHGAHEADVDGAIEGLGMLSKVISVDQSPIGRTPRSSPATYTGLFGPLREHFAQLPEARARGYKPGRFSFNVKGGRCEGCQGDGLVRIELQFLPDAYVECEHCGGRRYNRETLEIRYRGYNIADVLDMQVDEALAFFDAVPAIRERLEALHAVGLGYLELGRSATTLSGGEAQRIKLARELGRRAPGRTLYVLDEPTTGLHFADVEVLLEVLQQLVAAGHTVVVIEHHLDVIKAADWIVDLGPEGGDEGGRIVATGTPEQIAEEPASHTGRFVAESGL